MSSPDDSTYSDIHVSSAVNSVLAAPSDSHMEGQSSPSDTSSKRNSIASTTSSTVSSKAGAFDWKADDISLASGRTDTGITNQSDLANVPDPNAQHQIQHQNQQQQQPAQQGQPGAPPLVGGGGGGGGGEQEDQDDFSDDGGESTNLWPDF